MKHRFVFLYTVLTLIAIVPVNGTSSAWAQPTPPTATPEATEAHTPFDLNLDAKQALEALVARYQGLHSYSDVTTQENLKGEVQETDETTWERPNKVRVLSKKADAVVARGVSDGTTLWALNPEHAGYYLQQPAPPNTLLVPFLESDAGGPGMGITMSGDPRVGSPFREDANLRVLRFQGEAQVDGIKTRLITAKYEPPQGGTIVITCYVGVEDGLLHQFALQRDGESVVEKHTNIRLNPELPADTWKFTPPDGLKPTDSFAKLAPHRFDPLYKAGDVLPPFESTGINGKKVALKDYSDQNKVVLIYFFTVIGGNGEVAAHKALLAKYGNQGFAIIGVSLDGRRDAVEKFVQENAIPYPIVFDGKGWYNAVSQQYGVRSSSTMFLVGRDGRLCPLLDHLGGNNFAPVNLDKAIQDALKAPK